MPSQTTNSKPTCLQVNDIGKAERISINGALNFWSAQQERFFAYDKSLSAEEELKAGDPTTGDPRYRNLDLVHSLAYRYLNTCLLASELRAAIDALALAGVIPPEDLQALEEL